jgi:hypothetical protein
MATMNKLNALNVIFSLSLTSGAIAQTLTLAPSQSHTVVGSEVYDNLLMGPGSTLTVPEGTSITMAQVGNIRTQNDGGTIILNGGDFTVHHRHDMGKRDGATLMANSGTFSVLDWDFNPLDPMGANGMVMPDFDDSGPSVLSQIIIGDAEVFIEPTLNLSIPFNPLSGAERKSLITFTPDGTGFLDLQEIRGEPPSGPSLWLSWGVMWPGYGLFAPEGETIIIETLGNGHTRVTSRRVLSPSSLFTWEMLANGSWGNPAGWKENGAATTDIPKIDLENNLADKVEVLSGTVRVDTADQAAWSVDVKTGATAVVSNANTLRIAENVTIRSGGDVEVNSGGLLSVEQDLSIAASGVLTIHDGTVSVARNAAVAGKIAFTGTGGSTPGDYNGNGIVDAADYVVWRNAGPSDTLPNDPTPGVVNSTDYDNWKANFGRAGSTLSKLTLDAGSLADVEVSTSGIIETPLVNVGEASVGRLTMSSTSRLVKQGAGTLVLDQSVGANSLAAGAELSIEQGNLVAMNNSANNALNQGTIGIDGGTLVLTSKQVGAAAFNSPVQVRHDGIILAAQRGGGALAGATVTLGGSHGIVISGGAIGTLETADGYTINLAGNVSGPGRLDFGDGAAVAVQGNVTPAGVGYRGNLSNVSVSGSVAPTSSYFFNPTQANPNMTVGFAITGARDVVIGDLDTVDGSVGFTGTFGHTGATRLQRGALRVGGIDKAPSAGRIEFAAHDLDRAAVVESSTETYSPTIGTAAGNVHWTGAGGFASRQGGAGTTITINAGAVLQWDSNTNGFNGQALQLGSNTANAPLILTNGLNLGNAAERVIQVANNPGTTADVARITGVIASTGTSGDLLRINKLSGNGFHSGLLELLGNNTFANTLRLDSGAVFAVQGTGLPTNVNLQFSGNDTNLETVFATHGDFTRSIGTAAGQVSWAPNMIGVDEAQGGGFAARGGPLNVTLAGGTILWNSPSGLNGQDLHLGSQYADNVVTSTTI